MIAEGTCIGFDMEMDREHFTVSPSGVVVVPRGRTSFYPRRSPADCATVGASLSGIEPMDMPTYAAESRFRVMTANHSFDFVHPARRNIHHYHHLPVHQRYLLLG